MLALERCIWHFRRLHQPSQTCLTLNTCLCTSLSTCHNMRLSLCNRGPTVNWGNVWKFHKASPKAWLCHYGKTQEAMAFFNRPKVCSIPQAPNHPICSRDLPKTYPLSRNQCINNSPGVFSCFRPGANTCAACIRSENIFPQHIFMYWHQGSVNTATVSIQTEGAKVRIHICEGANTYFKNNSQTGKRRASHTLSA